MLVEFSVENHRVFREKQTFSMVASSAAGRAGNGLATGFSAVPHVLCDACLFGANGSGKTSLIDAIGFMSNFVRTSFRKEAGEEIPVEPFLFHGDWREKPSVFEAIFIHKETLYQYGFALTRERVVEEWLFARAKPSGLQHCIFTRIYDEENDNYEWEFSELHLIGERDSWRSQTRLDALFLSTAVQLDAAELRAPYDWFRNRLRILDFDSRLSIQYTLSRFEEDGWQERIKEFLRGIGIFVFDIVVQEKMLEWPDMNNVPKKLRRALRDLQSALQKETTTNQMALAAKFTRLDDQENPVQINIEKESAGTISLFALSGYFLTALDKGFVLVIDDLNSGLHPLAFRHLVDMFNKPSENKQGAQLIFTTHETFITESECMGRDQIWMVDIKNKTLAASLTPLSDYKTRSGRPFRKGYLQGRYGAVPRLGRA